MRQLHKKFAPQSLPPGAIIKKEKLARKKRGSAVEEII